MTAPAGTFALADSLTVRVLRPVEVYGDFLRITGAIEVPPPQRLSDVVNSFGDFLDLEAAVLEPLAVNHPVLSKPQERATIAKAQLTLLCPRDPLGDPGGQPALWRDKEAVAMSITTSAFSMVADAHLEPRHSLRDHLERYRGDFVPLTNLSALWVVAPAGETHALQRGFALLNPATILAFAARG